MKRIGIALLCALLAASLMTSCQNGREGGEQTSSQASSQVSSQASSSPAPSAPASSSEASSSEESGGESQQGKVYESGADYTLEIKEADPTEIDGISATMTVPVMSGAAAQKYGLGGEINRQINAAAQSVIADSGYHTGSLTLKSEVPFYSEKIISIVMTIDFTADGMAYPVHTVKTVNFLLGKSGFSDFASAIEDNDAFRSALTANNHTSVDDETLLAGVGDASLSFSETGVGIAVPVPHAVGDVAQVEIPYGQTGDFRTDDPVWDNFQ